MIDRSTRFRLLVLIGSLNALALLVLLSNPDLLRRTPPPDVPEAMAASLGRLPADWFVASALADAAFDASFPRRREVWSTAFDLAYRLAPRRENPRAGFVRAGLFHWSELSEPERRKVLDVAAPLLANPHFFAQMYPPLWQLTRDLEYLKRVAPDTLEAQETLKTLAATNGLFDAYRSLRAELRRESLERFERVRDRASTLDLLQMVPAPITRADEPLIRGLLEEIERKVFNPEKSDKLERLVSFVLDHRLQPVSGLLPVIETPGRIDDVTRARMALLMRDASLATRIEMASAIPGAPEWAPYYLDRASFEAQRADVARAEAYVDRARLGGESPEYLAGAAEVAKILGRTREVARLEELLRRRNSDATWIGACGANELCSMVRTKRYYTSGERISLQTTVTQSDEIPPYLEIYLDDLLVAEGSVAAERTFEVVSPESGMHQLEIRLANPRTRNGVQRRLRLS